MEIKGLGAAQLVFLTFLTYSSCPRPPPPTPTPSHARLRVMMTCHTTALLQDGYEHLCPVAALAPQNDYGLHNMIGNAWEVGIGGICTACIARHSMPSLTTALSHHSLRAPLPPLPPPPHGLARPVPPVLNGAVGGGLVHSHAQRRPRHQPHGPPQGPGQGEPYLAPIF